MQGKITKFNNNKEIKIKLVVNQIDIKDSFKLLNIIMVYNVIYIITQKTVKLFINLCS